MFSGTMLYLYIGNRFGRKDFIVAFIGGVECSSQVVHAVIFVLEQMLVFTTRSNVSIKGTYKGCYLSFVFLL